MAVQIISTRSLDQQILKGKARNTGLGPICAHNAQGILKIVSKFKKMRAQKH